MRFLKRIPKVFVYALVAVLCGFLFRTPAYAEQRVLAEGESRARIIFDGFIQDERSAYEGYLWNMRATYADIVKALTRLPGHLGFQLPERPVSGETTLLTPGELRWIDEIDGIIDRIKKIHAETELSPVDEPLVANTLSTYEESMPRLVRRYDEKVHASISRFRERVHALLPEEEFLYLSESEDALDIVIDPSVRKGR